MSPDSTDGGHRRKDLTGDEREEEEPGPLRRECVAKDDHGCTRGHPRQLGDHHTTQNGMPAGTESRHERTDQRGQGHSVDDPNKRLHAVIGVQEPVGSEHTAPMLPLAAIIVPANKHTVGRLIGRRVATSPVCASEALPARVVAFIRT